MSNEERWRNSVDEISDAPWVVERGSVAWMVREGENGPQVGNFILEADARWVAATRNAADRPAAAQGAAPRAEGRAASPAALDAQRLTLAMCRAFHGEDCAVTQYDAEQADQVAAEYARLASLPTEPEAIPPATCDCPGRNYGSGYHSRTCPRREAEPFA